MEQRPHYYKEKTPSELNQVLQNTHYFNTNWKKIPMVFRALNKILLWNNEDKDCWKRGASEITCHYFKNRFGNDYPSVILALESIGLLKVSRVAREGHCNMFRLTPKCHSVLESTNKEYLYKLRHDPIERRRNQNRISKRGYNKKVYGDVRDFQKHLMDNLQYDTNQMEKVINRYPEQEKRSRIWSLLILMEEKNYADLKYNDADGRVWTPFLQLPSEVKAFLQIDNGWYLRSGDIQSCHPSLWAKYILTISEHPERLQEELDAYNEVFLQGRDPKTYLSIKLDIPRKDIKEVLLKYFNGYPVGRGKKNPFRKFDEYLKQTFPLLYAEWQKTDISQTGNNISKWFETKLMLDGSIYRKAGELGYVLAYEYDGFSVYGRSKNNLEELFSFIALKSEELLGVRIVLQEKDNTWDLEQLLSDRQSEYLQKTLAEKKEKIRTICTRNHKRPQNQRDWRRWKQLKDETALLQEQLENISLGKRIESIPSPDPSVEDILRDLESRRGHELIERFANN